MNEINSGKDFLIIPAACVNAESFLHLNNVILTLFLLRNLTLKYLLSRGIKKKRI